jgi:hypothetical protein
MHVHTIAWFYFSGRALTDKSVDCSNESKNKACSPGGENCEEIKRATFFIVLRGLLEVMVRRNFFEEEYLS